MQQRQHRLGDILDDYCPRERRVTNHAVVAMVGQDVKQTRCTTCDAEHEYKHAKVPRQRRKASTPAALYSQVLASGPKKKKRIAPDALPGNGSESPVDQEDLTALPVGEADVEPRDAKSALDFTRSENAVAVPAAPTDPARKPERDEGPVHRPLIRASLPRQDGQPPQSRPLPEFTIRQPGGRPNRFRPRHPRSGQQFSGNRSNAGGASRGGTRTTGGRAPHAAKRHGRKRSK
jgi:hypothetical protein